jgi:hypothetical protein
VKVGDLVKFKVHHYHKSYGLGVVLGPNLSTRVGVDSRFWALFNNERLMVRLEELEIVSESR